MSLNSAIQHFQAKRFAQAEEACHQALSQNPDESECLFMLSVISGSSGQLDAGIDWIHRAIATGSPRADYWLQLAIFLRSKGDVEDAVKSFEKAVILKPDDPQIHYALANLLLSAGKYESAITGYEKALQLSPNLANARGNIASAYRHIGQLDKAIASLRRALELKPDSIITHDNLLLALLYHPDSTPQTLQNENKRWNQQHAARFAQHRKLFANTPDPNRRLRIGYVSPDFSNHPVARFIRPLLSHHDRERFEIFCYSQRQQPDELQAISDHRPEIFSLTDEQVAEKIRHDGIDILINLALHTAKNRLLVFARKPAPIQAVYLGYAGGCASEAIDYRITDRYLDPDQAEDVFYQQKAIRLDTTYWCYEPDSSAPDIAQIPANANSFVTFGSLNNFSKVSASVIELWAKILMKVPDSRLFLHVPEGDVRVQVAEQFALHRVATSRIEMVGRTGANEYFQTYNRIDIALDPFPFAGGTTTCDALWMGVPTITLNGRLPVGRAGVSILNNAGFPDWIAKTADEYVNVAAKLASDLPRLSEIRARMRDKLSTSNLMNAQEYTRGLESAYRWMWKQWCQSR